MPRPVWFGPLLLRLRILQRRTCSSETFLEFEPFRAVRGAVVFPFKERKMPIGTVKWFNIQKGFGFIQPEGAGQDVFVHISAVERAGLSNLVEGQKIEFEVERNQRSGKDAACNLKAT